jgi:ubiquinone/menaquinone biosynthesis C-methylase UbiE
MAPRQTRSIIRPPESDPLSLNLTSFGYRVAARSLFAPFGGLALIRRQALDAMQIRAGERVLELGCGPGELTAELLNRGARVHAVDVSEAMLRDARQRAPSASFDQADITRYVPDGRYDVILLSFVLHELEPADISAIVGHSASALARNGRLVIVDHSAPRGSAGRIWRWVLAMIEPTNMDHWLSIDLAALCRTNDLIPALDRAMAGGRARLVVAIRNDEA